MRYWKKTAAVWLAALLLMTLTACGKKAPAPDPPAETPEEVVELPVAGGGQKPIELLPAQAPPEGGEPSPAETAPETSGSPETAPPEADTDDPEPAGSGQTAEEPPAETPPEEPPPEEPPQEKTLPEDGSYTSKEDVALYIHLYGHLPGNFITKKEAEKLGWTGGSLERYAPGKCIGGSRFGNYEGLLPEKKGRFYTECDIDTLGAKNRGAKRIVFSNDGLIYYTGDHYASFELLYGEE